MLDDYVANAPPSAFVYTEPKWDKIHVSCKARENPSQGFCKFETAFDNFDPNVHERVLTPEDEGLYFERPALWEDVTKDPVQMKYKDVSRDDRVSYQSEKYPWIEAVHKFRVEKKHPQLWD